MRPAMFAALLLAAAAISQAVSPKAGVGPDSTAIVVSDTTETEAVSASFAPTESAIRDTVIAEAATPDSVATEAEVAFEVEAAPVVVARPAPARFASDATGFAMMLPAGWSGPSSVVEADLPAYAHYTFSGAASGTPLAGVTLHVEQVVGLNALDQQRWTRGLTPYGYHGLQPVGPASVPVAGLGIELAGPGVGGAVAFVQRGQTFWALHVQAPEAEWAVRQAEIVALLRAVEIP